MSNYITVILLLLVGLLSNKLYLQYNKGKFASQSKLVPNNKNIVGEGGLVFFTIFFLFFFVNYKFEIISVNWSKVPRFYSLFVGLFFLLVISFIDDRYDISKKIRFIIQIIICYLCTSALNLSFTNFPFKIELFLIVSMWVYIINISNFIDGLNGFFSINVLSFLIGSLVIIYHFNLNQEIIYFISILCLPLLLSFLFFNFPSAKIFFGDTGSIPMGFLIGYIMIYFLSLKIFIPIIFLFIYPILDVTITLVNKVLIRKKAPWDRLFDYFFLKPVINSNKSHAFVFNISFLLNFLNIILLIFYLKNQNILILFLCMLINLSILFYFSKFSKKG